MQTDTPFAVKLASVRIFLNGSFHELKIAKESKDLLVKVSVKPNQKSNDLCELSMNRKCGESVTTEDRRTFTKVLGADKDIVYRDQTVGKQTERCQV